MKVTFDDNDYVEYADQVASLTFLAGMPCNGKIRPKVVDCVLFTLHIDNSQMVIDFATDEAPITIPLERMIDYCPTCERFEITMHSLKYVPEVLESHTFLRWLQIGAMIRELSQMLQSKNESLSIISFDREEDEKDEEDGCEEVPGINEMLYLLNAKLKRFP
jgi:hypothetical protein